MRVSASELLRTLVGATIRSVAGRAVTILDLRGGEVIVATDRSPEGTSLSVERVQEALDRLDSDADAQISVNSLAHWSPWLAAVLLTLAAGRDRRVGGEDGTAAVDLLPHNGHPLTVDPIAAHRRRRRRRHARRKIRRRAIAVIVVTAISVSLGAAIVASTTEGGPVGGTKAAPEATVTAATERDQLGAVMGTTAEPTAAPMTKRAPVGATKPTPEATTADGAEQRSVGTKAEAVVTAGAPDARAGRRVFQAACKKCHTLTRGYWPADKLSLADLRPSYSTTRDKVTNGGVAMPSFKRKLSEQQIRDVAAFVAKVTARRARGVGPPD